MNVRDKISTGHDFLVRRKLFNADSASLLGCCYEAPHTGQLKQVWLVSWLWKRAV